MRFLKEEKAATNKKEPLRQLENEQAKLLLSLNLMETHVNLEQTSSERKAFHINEVYYDVVPEATDARTYLFLCSNTAT